MPSNKPRVTLRMDDDEYKFLEEWASKEFLTVPQLTRVIVKRAMSATGYTNAETKQAKQQKSA
jgi:hypothetical protein